MDWLTQGFDNQRTGWNPAETNLTTANVPNLRLSFTVPVDGQVYAQPLYVANLQFPNGQTHNVCYAATEGDSVYAFDADSQGPPLWQRQLTPPGETPVPWQDVQPPEDANIAPQIGITATPVIDRATGTLFAVAKTKQVPATYHYRLYALDLRTGADKPNSPVEISGGVAGSGSGQNPPGTIPFDPKMHLNRPGLLLDHGVVYIAFSSHADQTPYHGWVFAYAATTLAPQGMFCASPDFVVGQGGSLGDPGSGAGIWQAGVGLAADTAGSVYFLTGNGPFNANSPAGRDYGDSLVKVHLNGSLAAVGSFAPPNQAWLSNRDIDFGSGGVLLPPPQPGVYPDLLVCCGKYAVIYLLNRTDFRVLQAVQAGQVTNLTGGTPTAQGGIWGGPAYYSSPAGTFIYYALNNDYLKAFRLTSPVLRLATLGGAGFNQTPDQFPAGGATPVVSSNGATPGTAVVWAIRRGDPLTLRAYDATNLQRALFSGPAGGWDNPKGNPFIQPTVADGHVLVGSANQVAIFRL